MGAGRFAPSPTGDLHLGNLRTALLAWMFARHYGDGFLVRFEDLDAGSVRDRYYASQRHDLAALGLEPDKEPVRQSTRVGLYADALRQLSDAGLTYPCWCSRKEIRDSTAAPNSPGLPVPYPGTCRKLTHAERRDRENSGRPPALRVRAEVTSVEVDDELAGPFTGAVDDLVVQRGDGAYAYNLAVVIDDAEQGITRVVRGDDLLASTPRQAYLGGLLGLDRPLYAHVPLVLGSDGARLAKRHGSVTLADRMSAGDSVSRVLGRLASSLGIDAGDEADLPSILDAFDPSKLPTDPWVWRDVDTISA